MTYIPATPSDIWQTASRHMVSTGLVISSAVQNKDILYHIMKESLPLEIIREKWFHDPFKNLYHNIINIELESLTYL